jgi:hypothetical protein
VLTLATLKTYRAPTGLPALQTVLAYRIYYPKEQYSDIPERGSSALVFFRNNQADQLTPVLKLVLRQSLKSMY